MLECLLNVIDHRVYPESRVRSVFARCLRWRCHHAVAARAGEGSELAFRGSSACAHPHSLEACGSLGAWGFSLSLQVCWVSKCWLGLLRTPSSPSSCGFPGFPPMESSWRTPRPPPLYPHVICLGPVSRFPPWDTKTCRPSGGCKSRPFWQGLCG